MWNNLVRSNDIFQIQCSCSEFHGTRIFTMSKFLSIHYIKIQKDSVWENNYFTVSDTLLYPSLLRLCFTEFNGWSLISNLKVSYWLRANHYFGHNCTVEFQSLKLRKFKLLRKFEIVCQFRCITFKFQYRFDARVQKAMLQKIAINTCLYSRPENLCFRIETSCFYFWSTKWASS